MKSKFWVLMATMMFGADGALAMPATIVNPSFESPVTSSYTANTATGWACYNAGVFSSTVLPAQDGQQCAIALLTGSSITQVLAETIQPGKIYTLSVYVGDRTNAYYGGHDIRLYDSVDNTTLAEEHTLFDAGGNPLAPMPPNGGWLQRTIVYACTSVDAGRAGHALGIYLAKNDPWASSQTGFDLVQLNVTDMEVTLTGIVVLSDYVGVVRPSLRVQLIQSGSVVRTEHVILESGGTFSVAGLPLGLYDIAVKTPCWLRKVVSNVTLAYPSTGLGTVTLTSGDGNGDNFVTGTDLSMVLADMNQVGQ